jgi:hypothetical protein
MPSISLKFTGFTLLLVGLMTASLLHVYHFFQFVQGASKGMRGSKFPKIPEAKPCFVFPFRQSCSSAALIGTLFFVAKPPEINLRHHSFHIVTLCEYCSFLVKNVALPACLRTEENESN